MCFPITVDKFERIRFADSNADAFGWTDRVADKYQPAFKVALSDSNANAIGWADRVADKYKSTGAEAEQCPGSSADSVLGPIVRSYKVAFDHTDGVSFCWRDRVDL